MKIKLTILFVIWSFCQIQAQECSCVCSTLTAPLSDPLTLFVATEQQCTDQCAFLMYASSQFVGALCSCMGAPNLPDPSPPANSPSEADCATACMAAGYDNSVCTPVPVELVFFKAEIMEASSILLEWQTASELNNAGFEIERSLDGVNWQLLDFVKGYGTTVEIQNYKWQDNVPLVGTAYYRLRQVDTDGTFDYSELVSVNLKDDKATELIVWPNPTKSTLYFQLVGQDRYYGESLQIYDGFGRLLKTKLADRLHLQDNQGEIGLEELPTGLYFISLQIEGKTFNQKFMKQ